MIVNILMIVDILDARRRQGLPRVDSQPDALSHEDKEPMHLADAVSQGADMAPQLV